MLSQSSQSKYNSHIKSGDAGEHRERKEKKLRSPEETDVN
jgi:hypothetical protein